MTSVNVAIVSIYLIISIVIGVYYGKQVKSVKDFTVGDRNFSVLLLLFTTFPTWIDSNSIFDADSTMFKIATVYLVTLIAQIIGLLSYYFFFIERIQQKFKNAISIGEIMKSLYSTEGTIITGIASTIFSIIVIAIQFKIMSMIFSHFFGLSINMGIFLSALIILAYTIFGGAKVVLMSDLLQFFIIVTTAYYLLIEAFPQVESISSSYNIFDTYSAFNTKIGNEDIINYVLIFLYNAIPMLTPPIVQRILMTDSKQKAKIAFGMSGVLMIPFYFIIILISLINFGQHPESHDNTFLTFIDWMSHSAPQGICIAGLLAFAMSTADSYMHTASISISHDITKTIFKEKLSEYSELEITKYCKIFIVLFSFFIAFYSKCLIQLQLWGLSIWATTVTVPLIIGIFGFRIPKNVFYFYTLTGILTIVFFHLFEFNTLMKFGNIIAALFIDIAIFVIIRLTSPVVKNTSVKNTSAYGRIVPFR